MPILTRKSPYFKQFARFLGEGLDLLFPPTCLVCCTRQEIQPEGMICKGCWEEIFQPLPISLAGTSRSFYAIAAGEYGGALKDLIRRAKFSSDPLPLSTLTLLLKRTLETKSDAPADWITAVPGSPKRLRERGVDLPALLARRLSGKIGVSFSRNILQRVREAPAQTSLGRRERLRNLEGAFVCGADLEGKQIVVVDDVTTTGATALAIASALDPMQPAGITFLAVARTPEGMEDRDPG